MKNSTYLLFQKLSVRTVTLIISITFFSFNTRAQLYINEIVPSNITGIMDDLYDYPDSWAEIYNDTDEDKDIINYSFTDNNSKKQKWILRESLIIPAKGYKIIYFDKEDTGLHANFRLDIGGATLYMYDPSGNEVDRFKYKKELYNTTYARVPDGSSNITTVREATPGATNNNSDIATERCEAPVIETENYFFGSYLKIKVSSPTPGSKIHYTSTGTEPTSSSSVVPEDGTLLVSSTRTFKFKAMAEGYLESPTTTKTVFIGLRQIDLPIVSISTNPKHITDNKIGIYVIGTNGRVDNCITEPQNYNQPWRRPVNIEIFESSHVDAPVINQTAEMRIAGGCSRNNDQKSLIVYANKRFGTKRFNHDFFHEKPGMEIKSFMLRNTGNDYYDARLRDPYIQTLVAGNVDIDYQAYQPAVLFINGSYYGIQNIRERSNEDFILSNYGLEEEDIDLISLEIDEPLISAGDKEAYNLMIDFARNNDISVDNNYRILESQIDIDEYINYMFIEIFCGNRDWPANNCKLWRPREEGGKWRWILMDTDFGMGYNGLSSSHNTLLYAMGELYYDTWMSNEWSTVLFRSLMDNTEFRNKFINRTMTAIGDFLHEDIVTNVADSLAGNIYDESGYHANKWNVRGTGSWMSSVNEMKSWPVRRGPRMINFLRDRFRLNETISLTLNTIHPTGNVKKIKINDNLLSQYKFDGNAISGTPIILEARDIEGYDFERWEVTRITGNSNSITSSTSPKYTISTPSSVRGVDVKAIYRENEILSVNKNDSKNNFNIMTLSDGVRVNYSNSSPTSMYISLYTLDGMLIDNINYEEKNTDFSLVFDYPDNIAKVYILKCKTDFDTYTFKIMK